MHRSELGLIFARYGHSPGDLDYLDFIAPITNSNDA
jgi:hypothetical protein